MRTPSRTLFFSILFFLVGIFLWLNRISIQDYFFRKHVIFWSKNVTIGFKDFQDKPNNESGLNVNFYHGFILKSDPICQAKAEAYFDKNKSWVKDTTKFNFQDELKLQRLGFNLAEVYTRKFNKNIDSIKCNGKTDYEDLEEIGDRIFEEYSQMESEIFNSGNKTPKEIIKFWEPKINDLLKE